MYLGYYPVTTTTVTTHIIVTTNLLTLTNVELEAQVEAELAENPALEMAESLRCPRCGQISGVPAPTSQAAAVSPFANTTESAPSIDTPVKVKTAGTNPYQSPADISIDVGTPFAQPLGACA